MSWGGPVPEGEFRLYVRRLGENEEFAYYPAIQIAGGEITFQVDDLLFEKGTGRYEGRLVVNNQEYAKVQINYKASNTLVAVENRNV
jgi:hypothetical protein